ncbi:class I SAM-dependent methyltransferase [Candidatus Aminicenantes bacterium AC-335-A11]|jgi:ubiquinone/menaquinone biosynthesis C-methylase UbiE|nr:class I SAM-dependent methyltransferase [SCandidatus Aminicenantes bacterium Aminicenantia_JdfR_composite]MCP2596519.1 class I SAM-dependent methyltransferase [Candidatus Aminicenantes bacterium AC-335-G13]MCP2618113.1 class I SAM-dependent methyltransferase [Candidatus Aminicenantes bacterium AC-335-A11]
MRNMQNHFSEIASKYRELRITDIEPILYIKGMVKDLSKIVGADVGCGTGRYSLKLLEHLGDKLNLFCIDYNEKMLIQLNKYFTQKNIENFKIMRAKASDLPIKSNSLDCIFAFNAIHHFKFKEFLDECSRILKNNRYLFIYTRLKSQNYKNIWGKYFPGFTDKENRLYELDELESIINQVEGLSIHSVKFFKFKRIMGIQKVLEKARNRHYSTFYLYDEKELERAINTFKQNLCANFKDMNRIQWFDEYTLVTVKSGSLENC